MYINIDKVVCLLVEIIQVPKNASPAIHVKMAEYAYLACMTTVASALPVSLVNNVVTSKVRVFFAKYHTTFNAYLL